MQPKKNSLSALKGTGQTKSVLTEKGSVRISGKKTIGRPKKNVQEKRNHKITISFTEAEASIITEKAGLVPHSTYLLALLTEAGVFK